MRILVCLRPLAGAKFLSGMAPPSGHAASEEPRPLLFVSAGWPTELCPGLDTSELRHTYTSVARGGLRCGLGCERSKQLVAAKSRRSKGTLLIGINLGVASGCNHCLVHETWDHAFDRASTTAPLRIRPTSRHRVAYFRLPRTGGIELSSSPVWPHGTRATGF